MTKKNEIPAEPETNGTQPDQETMTSKEADLPSGEPAPEKVCVETGDVSSRTPEADPVQLLAETFKAEKAELEDKLLRARAEMENLRRRADREKAEATLYAATNFARDMLPVSDNLTRALEALPHDQRADLDDATANLIAGIEMTTREFHNVLERHGIKRIDPAGEKFDPHLHQAMFEVPADEPPGTVVQVVQSGYLIGERVLRPAMVGVAAAKKAEQK